MGVVEDAILKYENEERRLEQKAIHESYKFINEKVKPEFKERFGDYDVEFIPQKGKTCLIKLDEEIVLRCYEQKLEYYSSIRFEIFYQCKGCGETYPSYNIYNLVDLGREVLRFRKWKKEHRCKVDTDFNTRIVKKLYSLMEDILVDMGVIR